MIRIFMKYCKFYNRVFLYLTIPVSCNSQPARAQHYLPLGTFYVQSIWQHMGFSLGIFTKINLYFSLEKTPLRHWKFPLVHTKTQLSCSFPLLFFSSSLLSFSKAYNDKWFRKSPNQIKVPQADFKLRFKLPTWSLKQHVNLSNTWFIKWSSGALIHFMFFFYHQIEL